MAKRHCILLLCVLCAIHQDRMASLATLVHRICDIASLPDCSCEENFRGIRIGCDQPSWTEIPAFPENLTAIHTFVVRLANLSVVDTHSLLDVAIKKVYLSKNQITRIEPAAFSPTHGESIKLVDLSDNLLTEIPPAINNLTSLRVLVLSGNRITVVDFDSLTDLMNLASLYVDDNPVLYSDSVVYGTDNYQPDEVLPSLRKLVVSFDVTSPLALGSDALIHSLRDNLTNLAVADTALASVELGQGFTNLKVLALEGCDLTTEKLRAESFSELEGQLLALILPRNLLTEVPLERLSNMSLLQYLDLSYNQITRIDAFPQFQHLLHLDFKANRITFISNDALTGLPSRLRFLDLSNNALAAFSPRFFKDDRWLNREILIGGNPLSCDCTNNCLIDSVQQGYYDGEGPFRGTEQSIRCNAEGNNILLRDVNITELGCCQPSQCCN